MCIEDKTRYKLKLEGKRVFEFYLRLDHELDEVRSRIIGQRPLPTTREVFAEVRREERRRNVMLREGSKPLSTLTSHWISRSSGNNYRGPKKYKSNP